MNRFELCTFKTGSNCLAYGDLNIQFQAHFSCLLKQNVQILTAFEPLSSTYWRQMLHHQDHSRHLRTAKTSKKIHL